MRYKGIDTAAPLTDDNLKKAKENGISFVCRYLVPTTMWKAITPTEIKRIQNAGMALLLCWEIDSGDMKGGSSKGIEHGSRARQLAESYGVPYGTTIYFACDYNVQNGEYLLIENYLRGAALAIGDKYKVGLYGHKKIIDYIGPGLVINKFWQCVAWSYGLSNFTNVYQYKWQDDPEAQAFSAKIGVNVDLDACDDLQEAGLWMPPEPEKHDPWYKEAMDWVEKNHIMNDGRPKDNVTRAELATVLKRYHFAFGPEDSKEHYGLGSDD